MRNITDTIQGGRKTLSFLLVALCAVALSVPLQTFAADWTDADGNEYNALKSIKGTATVSNVNPGTASDCTLVANYNTREYWVNGTKKSSFGTAGTFTPGSTLLLFAMHGVGSDLSESTAASSISGRATHALYYFQLYTSAGVLKHNLMPAEDANGTAGLYDTVTRKFYPQATNSVTGFTKTARSVTAYGVKWTGLGGDNKMSTAANSLYEASWSIALRPLISENLVALYDGRVVRLAAD